MLSFTPSCEILGNLPGERAHTVYVRVGGGKVEQPNLQILEMPEKKSIAKPFGSDLKESAKFRDKQSQLNVAQIVQNWFLVRPQFQVKGVS